MKLSSKPEFIFSYGILGRSSDAEPEADSLRGDEAAKALAEKLCFERFSYEDVKRVFLADDGYPRINFRFIEARDNDRVVFSSFKPTKREIITTPENYSFERADVGAWEKEQNCGASENGCLP